MTSGSSQTAPPPPSPDDGAGAAPEHVVLRRADLRQPARWRIRAHRAWRKRMEQHSTDSAMRWFQQIRDAGR